MKTNFKKIISLVLTGIVAASLVFAVSPKAEAAASSGEVAILGTVIKTREYYNVNGPVSAYGFFPAQLSTYKVGGKQVEITEFGAGTETAVLGTNDLSSYAGLTGIYTGTIAKSTVAPYQYTFVIKSYTPANGLSAAEMNAYLTSLGFENTMVESSSTEWFIGSYMNNNTIAFSYTNRNGYSGEITAYILHEDFTPDFGIPSCVVGSNAKAQLIARTLSQYATGAISRDKMVKFINKLS